MLPPHPSFHTFHTYSGVGGGGELSPPPPPITISPHYTAASETLVHKITNVPVFFYMELILNDFEAGNNNIARLKIITYYAK
jgi:hypothetical protein